MNIRQGKAADLPDATLSQVLKVRDCRRLPINTARLASTAPDAMALRIWACMAPRALSIAMAAPIN